MHIFREVVRFAVASDTLTPTAAGDKWEQKSSLFHPAVITPPTIYKLCSIQYNVRPVTQVREQKCHESVNNNNTNDNDLFWVG